MLQNIGHIFYQWKEKNPYLYQSLVWILILIYCSIEANQHADLEIYLNGSIDLMNGENPYQNLYHNYYHYLYSPLFAVLIYPLSLLPYYWSAFLWLIGLAIFTKYLIKWMAQQSYFKLDGYQRFIFEIILFLVSIRFLRDNFHLQQITILIFAMSIYGLDNIFRKVNPRPFVGALMLALALNIKILPIIFIPYLFYRAKWKALCWLVVFSAIFILFPSIFLGFKFNYFLHLEWFKLINPTNTNHIIDNEEVSFHSLTTFISVYFHEAAQGRIDYNPRRYIIDLDVNTLNLVIQSARLLFVGLTLWILRLPFFKQVSPEKYYVEVSWLLVCIPLIFPHQQFYAFIFCIPMLSIVMYDYYTSVKKPIN